MKMKKVVSMLLVGAMTLSLAACSGGKSSGSSDDKSSSKGGSDKKSYHVIYLTPSTASQFWTYVGIGIENAMKDIEESEGITVDYEVVGPAEESQTEDYVQHLNSVSENSQMQSLQLHLQLMQLYRRLRKLQMQESF